MEEQNPYQSFEEFRRSVLEAPGESLEGALELAEEQLKLFFLFREGAPVKLPLADDACLHRPEYEKLLGWFSGCFSRVLLQKLDDLFPQRESGNIVSQEEFVGIFEKLDSFGRRQLGGVPGKRDVNREEKYRCLFFKVLASEGLPTGVLKSCEKVGAAGSARYMVELYARLWGDCPPSRFNEALARAIENNLFLQPVTFLPLPARVADAYSDWEEKGGSGIVRLYGAKARVVFVLEAFQATYLWHYPGRQVKVDNTTKIRVLLVASSGARARAWLENLRKALKIPAAFVSRETSTIELLGATITVKDARRLGQVLAGGGRRRGGGEKQAGQTGSHQALLRPFFLSSIVDELSNCDLLVVDDARAPEIRPLLKRALGKKTSSPRHAILFTHASLCGTPR
ncbi:MAG: hypothetical protein ACTSU5_05760 [Promethearchaeota archaeon]